MNVYLDTNVPGAGNDGVKWTSICNGPRPFMWISFEKYRYTSRWNMVDRKRPFIVQLVGKSGYWTEVGTRKTLSGAMDLAKVYAEVRS